MISGRGYQTPDPLRTLAPGNCVAILAGSPLRFPGARGPPMPSSAAGVSGPMGLELTATPARHDAGPGGGAAPAQL
jgi:hypothetical protein